MKFRSTIIFFLYFLSCNLNESGNKNHIYIPSKNNNRSNFDQPNIKFSKLDFNFGIVNKGQVISRYITFKNDGKRDLVISNVKSIYFISGPNFSFVSSSLIRDILKHGGKCDHLLPFKLNH